MGAVATPLLVHPLYVELQKRQEETHSKYKDKIDFSKTIGVVDGNNKDKRISLSQFYTTYVSQSIPLKLKGYAKDWKMY